MKIQKDQAPWIRKYNMHEIMKQGNVQATQTCLRGGSGEDPPFDWGSGMPRFRCSFGIWVTGLLGTPECSSQSGHIDAGSCMILSARS